MESFGLATISELEKTEKLQHIFSLKRFALSCVNDFHEKTQGLKMLIWNISPAFIASVSKKLLE